MNHVLYYPLWRANQYDSVTQLTEKTSLKLKEAKQKHELLNDQHTSQCVLIPENGDLTK